MEYIFRDTNGQESNQTDFAFLQSFIDTTPAEHWKIETGSSAIQVKEGEQLIFFATNGGYFVLNHPAYEYPEVKQDDTILEHVIGGEPFSFPARGICEKGQLLDILYFYVMYGTLNPVYEWLTMN
jgi:hypothetical protein